MNKYPFWLNTLVLVILVAGCLLALPNMYGSVPAVQIADNNGVAYDQSRLDEYVQARIKVRKRCWLNSLRLSKMVRPRL